MGNLWYKVSKIACSYTKIKGLKFVYYRNFLKLFHLINVDIYVKSLDDSSIDKLLKTCK